MHFLNRRTPQEEILSHHRGRHTFLKIMQEVGNKSVKLLHPTEIQMIDLENPLPFMGIMQWLERGMKTRMKKVE